MEYDLVLMFKICHNLCDLNFYEFLKLRKSRYNLYQHSLTVESLFHPKHEQYHYFFFNCIVNMQNNLPESIISTETLPIFKRRLHKFDLHNIAKAEAILPLEAKEPHVILPFGGKIVLAAILSQVPK